MARIGSGIRAPRRGSAPRAAVTLTAALAAACAVRPPPATAQAREAVVYSVSVPAPETHVAKVEASLPTGGEATLDVMMPVWSPGYYRVEDYAAQVREISARTPDGRPLEATKTRPNRWRVTTGGADRVVLSYELLCEGRSVTTNQVSPELGIFNGAATFITLAERGGHRPHEVRLQLPTAWRAAATGLPPAAGSPTAPPSATGLPPVAAGDTHRWLAPDYDALVDSPIVAGDLDVHTFPVQGVPHDLVDAGDVPDGWDGARAAGDLARIVEETLPLWGTLPYERYVFLNVFRRGGGGLEHRNSTLLTVGERAATPEGYPSWLSFVAHEYFHAFNVKRLRPVELGPFDYEDPPRTPSLWLSEGVTSYFGDLFVTRAGLMDAEDFLASMSSAIGRLQSSPGRLLQTLEQSSLEVWTNSNSGVGAAPSTVSYYLKGEVVGFLLDARIRTATAGRRSLEDVMRLAYERYGGERGFTPEELRATTEKVAGVDLEAWFQRALASTEELDYTEALEWYGLAFAADGSWRLEVRDDATRAQRAHLRDLLASASTGQEDGPAVRGGMPARQAPPTPQEALPIRGEEPPPNGIWVETVGLDAMFQRRGRPVAGGVPGGRGGGVRPITLGGVVYPHGIGTQSISEFVIDLKGQATRFLSMVGLDDSATSEEASVNFEVWGDDELLFATDTIRPGDPPRAVSVDLTGKRVLTLLLDDAQDTSNGDLGVWAGAAIVMREGATATPEPYDVPTDPAPPIASGDPPEPRIHGPLIVGATPGRPFHHHVPATGEGPLRYAAEGLPAGLAIDPATGIITGELEAEGRTVVELSVTGPRGRAARELTVVGGRDRLALTPPMGWNSWNAWGRTVDDAKVRAAADALVESGLADHGFTYVVIDDGWEGERDAEGVLRPNEKFPDMKALADYVHGLGLKFGLYSSPGPTTCQGLPGSWQHEELDARTWAEWGVDYLKYDYCGYSRIAADRSVAELRKPYDLMGDILEDVDRDIVYSIGEYGWGDVWEWGESAGGNLWRTTGDLENSWANLESVGFRQAGREVWAGPGHWNDTDMLIVGSLSWGRGEPRPTHLTRNEQILHITLWALQAAPLMLGADLSQLDPWTVDLLTNDEVLAVTLDTLGVAGGRVWKEGRLEVWARPLHDGTRAVGLFNRGLEPYDVTVRFADLGLSGAQPVRDLWRQEDLGTSTDAFTAEVPRHGAVMLKIGRPAGG